MVPYPAMCGKTKGEAEIVGICQGQLVQDGLQTLEGAPSTVLVPYGRRAVQTNGTSPTTHFSMQVRQIDAIEHWQRYTDNVER